jgi:hypothetical protein
MKKTRFELPSRPNDWIVKPFSVPQRVWRNVPLAKPMRNGFPLAVKQLSAHAGLAPASSEGGGAEPTPLRPRAVHPVAVSFH